MKRGFTLLELIVVIIIIGILATLGFVQYTNVIEKGRRAEAASILGSIRTHALVWNQEGGHPTNYPDNAYITATLTIPSSGAACGAGVPASNFYFGYTIDSATGSATATRCTANGKSPACTGTCTGYSLSLAIDGTKSSVPANLW